MLVFHTPKQQSCIFSLQLAGALSCDPLSTVTCSARPSKQLGNLLTAQIRVFTHRPERPRLQILNTLGSCIFPVSAAEAGKASQRLCCRETLCLQGVTKQPSRTPGGHWQAKGEPEVLTRLPIDTLLPPRVSPLLAPMGFTLIAVKSKPPSHSCMGTGHFQDFAALQDWGFVQMPNLRGPAHLQRTAREALQSSGTGVGGWLLLC